METAIKNEKQVKLFSHVVSPPVIFAVLGFILAWTELPFWPGLMWGVIYGVLVSLLPVLFVVYLLQTGRVQTISMTREERNWPYFVAVVFSCLTAAIIYFSGGPNLLLCVSYINILGLAAMGIINLYWQISNHATAIASSAVVVGAVFGNSVGLALSPLILLVCAARLYLHKHTPSQLVGGTILGVLTAMMLVLTGCFGG